MPSSPTTLSSDPHPAPDKTQHDIAAEWDDLAPLRDQQIRSGKDLSFHHVLVPCIKDLAANADWSTVLDVGCGTGALAERIYEHVENYLVGVDVSGRSIDVAQSQMDGYDLQRSNTSSLLGQERILDRKSPIASLVHASIQSYAAQQTRHGTFSLAVANMTMMDVLDLKGAMTAVASLLEEKGTFVFTITHPRFWSTYKGYANADWFEYTEEIVIEAPFEISLGDRICPATHVHRPLGMYLATLRQAGFVVEAVEEPMPSPKVEAQYPTSWDVPHFLAVRARLTDSEKTTT